MAILRRMRGACEIPLFPVLVSDASPGEVGQRLFPETDAFRLMRGWLSADAADDLFERLRRTTRWRAERRQMYDRVVAVPREQARYGAGCEHPWTPELASLRDVLASLAEAPFRYVLVNRYRDGADSVAWHGDRSGDTIVASLSLGATRAFDVRTRALPHRIVSVDLEHGDLVIMGRDAQAHYEHRIGKDGRARGERINLTFRMV